MSGVPAKFASALFVGIVAGAAWTALPQHAAQAADCLTEPKNETLQGQHWYFRIERGTGRHCWYMRGEDEKSVRADTPDPAPVEKPAPQRTEAATTRSIADAHAEIGPRARVPGGTAAAAAPSVWPNAAPAAAPANAATSNAPAANAPAATGTMPPLAGRWPQSSGSATIASQPPEASVAVADTQPTDAQPADAQPANVNADTSTQTLPPPMLAAAPVERNTGSIQKLLLVAVGALALAGLTGSAVYRLGRRRRRNHWLKERTAWNSAQNPNSPPWVDPQLGQADTLPDLDEVRAAAPDSDFSIAMAEDDSNIAMTEGNSNDARVEKIEDYLARLTKQLQAELEGSRPNRAEQRDIRAAS
jgi:hypothetical protein